MRAFLAVDVPLEIREKLSSISGEMENKCIKAVPLDNMHITLAFLGEISEKQGEGIVEKLGDRGIRKEKVVVKGLGVFPSVDYVRVVWAGAYGLDSIENSVRSSLQELNMVREESRKWHGHITIARVKCKADVKSYLEKYNGVEFGTFNVNAITLYKSVLAKPHAIYEKIADIKLG
ncbi:MAG: RNA 2',3'-cyclic phosphodiesterase [Methanobacteriota archaeon]|nr:MAG: RNA 2',3'-cyclic phosphodiesterase [Euryarchaeota archaeon]